MLDVHAVSAHIASAYVISACVNPCLHGCDLYVHMYGSHRCKVQFCMCTLLWMVRDWCVGMARAQRSMHVDLIWCLFSIWIRFVPLLYTLLVSIVCCVRVFMMHVHCYKTRLLHTHPMLNLHPSYFAVLHISCNAQTIGLCTVISLNTCISQLSLPFDFFGVFGYCILFRHLT